MEPLFSMEQKVLYNVTLWEAKCFGWARSQPEGLGLSFSWVGRLIPKTYRLTDQILLMNSMYTLLFCVFA